MVPREVEGHLQIGLSIRFDGQPCQFVQKLNGVTSAETAPSLGNQQCVSHLVVPEWRHNSPFLAELRDGCFGTRIELILEEP